MKGKDKKRTGQKRRGDRQDKRQRKGVKEEKG